MNFDATGLEGAQRRQQAESAGPDAPGGGAVLEVTEQTFNTDVVERSRTTPVIIDLWAEWCQPCKQEVPRLEAAYRKWAGKGVVFVGIDAQDFVGDAKRFADKLGITYPIVHDAPGKTVDSYGVTGFPETFFVGRNGKLVGTHVAGAVSADELAHNIPLALAART